MDTFGNRLTSEREDRGLSIQDVAEILSVNQNHLRALERNDFDALPDEAEMMACLNAYAECLEVDADLMIEDYLQERENHLRKVSDFPAAQVTEAAPTPIPPAEISPTAAAAEKGRPLSSLWLLPLAAAAIVALTALWMLSQAATAPPSPATGSAAPLQPQKEPPATEAIDSDPPETIATVPLEKKANPRAGEEVVPPSSSDAAAAADPVPVDPPAVRADPTLPVLRVTEHGVGAAVVDLQLVGRSTQFPEGTRVAFWTRVRDASRGERIDHVWLRQGVEAGRVALSIDGSNWRTHSIKTLYPGSAGNWTVEARDDSGRVLARSEFVCAP